MSNKSEPVQDHTPLMRQFNAIKAQHPDKILFFRMGDFYEMFGEDAVRAAPILGIALTSRSHGKGDRTPLAGVPYHAAERYLARLLKAGEKVVVVEQVEDPKTAKGLVKRDIVEILTPGTATIDDPELAEAPIRLAALCGFNGKGAGLAVLDLTTGAFSIDEGEPPRIIERLRVMEPAELLYPADVDKKEIERTIGLDFTACELTDFGEWNFDYSAAVRELNAQFGTSTLEGFGIRDEKQAVGAAGAIIRYLKENHREKLSHLNAIARFDNDERMTLDYNTVRNLELVRNLSGGSEDNSLFSVVNFCHTAGGGRRLKANLLAPFKQRAKIEMRLAAVAELVTDRDLAFRIRQQTHTLPDLEKLAGRLGIGKLSPRQMEALAAGLTISRAIAEVVSTSRSPLMQSLASALPDLSAVADNIRAALVDEPPHVTGKGEIIRRGYSDKLDNLNDSIKEARQYIGSLQAIERERTGISTLKVGFNKVFGYYLEITKANTKAVPDDYIRKQTLVNAERYITPELKQKEELILAAEEKIFRLEEQLYSELTEYVGQSMAHLLSTADILSEIDLVTSLAELAVARGYHRPEIFEDTRLLIENGRHPVIESVLPPGSFVANDLRLDSQTERVIILTGPNMSGKSTYLRQIGLITILAQIGSFVPADKAEIGLVDRVFTRVGALDNLARGQSTFLVEMVETANILNNATERSLVLLDEVGRGTSTFDGLSVAWAVVEHINEKNLARTVFATHFHELTEMASSCEHIRNYQVAVKKWEDSVVFLHKIIEGGCDDSYGIEVARLAGVPRKATARARQILRLLESGQFRKSELGRQILTERVQTSLFDPQPSSIEQMIDETDIENMTPVQAFDFLLKLKEKMKS